MSSDFIQSQETPVTNSSASADVTTFAIDTPTQTGYLTEAAPIPFLAPAPDSGHLGDFLSRPVLIDSFVWTTASAPNKHIDPWALFLNDTLVLARINNFCRLRANLQIEIQINGTPFHYGAILASYEPCNGLRHSKDGDWRQHSNLSHGFIDPTTSTTVKLTGPFIRPDYWIDLLNLKGAQVGVLNFDTVVGLYSASTVVEPLTVTTYAWMTDVELCFPTPLDIIGFTPQAKKVTKKKRANVSTGTDEYEINPNAGLISGPAATIASIAGKLTTIPVIGPFATATEIAATSLGQIAKLFGYSRPLDLTAPSTNLVQTVGRMAVTDQTDNAVSMTLSSKSGISIDPRIIGLNSGEDELVINSIASKPTLMSVISWDTTAASGSLLSSVAVSPVALCTQGTGIPGQRILMSAVGFSAVPFSFWHGTMIFRYKIVCSKYHRGRLRFEYNPSSIPGGTHRLNNTYNHIVDICNGKEFEVVIPWAQPQPYLPVNTIGNVVGTPNNGFVQIYVQNELSAPDSTTDVQILQWVYGGGDLSFAVPTQSYQFWELDKQSGREEDAVTEVESIQFFESPTHPEHDKAIFGDPIRSFRAVAKRWDFVTTIAKQALGGDIIANGYSSVYQIKANLYPQRNGAVTYGTDRSTTTDFNTNTNHIVTFLEPSFLAKKGGFRWMVDDTQLEKYCKKDGINISNRSIQLLQDAQVAALAETFEYIPSTTNSNSTVEYLSQVQRNLAAHQLFGNPDVGNNALAVAEIPYYTPFRYSTGFGTDTSPYYPRTRWQYFMRMSNSTGLSMQDAKSAFVALYAAAAEDFTMHVFLGVPQWKITAGHIRTTNATTRPTAFPGY